MTNRVYVSITGLRIKQFWHLPVFWRLASASMAQARRAPGCLSVEARTIDGVHHTLSAWSDEDAMRAFLHTGAHLKAIKAFHRIATGRTFGVEMSEVPGWEVVHEIWQKHGRAY